MHLNKFFMIGCFFFALCFQSTVFARTQVFSGQLSGANVQPVNSSPATGLVTVSFDLDLLTMRVQTSFSGLSGNTSASHIHCCTINAGTGNVGVATQTPSFAGFPTGVRSGAFDSTFNMNINSSYNAAFLTANGGSAGSAFNQLLSGLNAGKAYFTIHTNAFPGGEVRAFLTPVPEAEPISMMLAGMGVFGFVARRRQQQRAV